MCDYKFSRIKAAYQEFTKFIAVQKKTGQIQDQGVHPNHCNLQRKFEKCIIQDSQRM